MRLTYTWRGDVITRTGHRGRPYPLQKISRLPDQAKAIALDNLRAVIAHSGPAVGFWDRGNGKLEELQP